MSKKEKGIQLTCLVANKKGLHARAAAKIVTLANQYDSELILTHKNKSAPGLSLIKLLTLDAPQGSHINILATGIDAEAVSIAVKELFSIGFGELDE